MQWSRTSSVAQLRWRCHNLWTVGNVIVCPGTLALVHCWCNWHVCYFISALPATTGAIDQINNSLRCLSKTHFARKSITSTYNLSHNSLITAASYSVWPEKNNPLNIWSLKLHKSEVQIERGQDKTSSHSQGKQLDQTDNRRRPPGCRVGRFVEDWERRASKPGAACSIIYASTLHYRLSNEN